MRSNNSPNSDGWTKGPRPELIGADVYLDRDIGLGLFEACNGNKYLITNVCGAKVALALQHRHVPAFTCHRLNQ